MTLGNNKFLIYLLFFELDNYPAQSDIKELGQKTGCSKSTVILGCALFLR